MDKPTTALADLIGRVQPQIDAANGIFEAQVSDAIAELEASGSIDDFERAYLFLGVLQGTYCRGARIMAEAREALLPGFVGEPIVEPITKPAVH